MQITDVRVRRLIGKGITKAVASITIDSVFVVHELKIIEGKDGLFVAMPNHSGKDGRFIDIVHPLNTETRRMIQDIVLKAYNELEK